MVFKATISLPLKISLVCLAVGLIVFFIGFGGYNWASISVNIYKQDVSVHFGLWVGCITLGGPPHNLEVCRTNVIAWNDPTGNQTYPRDWMMATRATACLAVITLTACVICVIVFLFTNNRLFIIVSCAAAFVTCLLAIVTSVVFARDISNKFTDFKLDWAFAFNIISAIIFFASGVCDVIYMLTAVDNRRLRRPTAAA